MKIFRQKKWKAGWILGDFEPTAFKTKECEVCYKIHPKGEKWEKHFHKIATEINFLIKGKMRILNKKINSGDTFIIYPNEIANPEFLEDCQLIVVKIPSIQNDKYIVD